MTGFFIYWKEISECNLSGIDKKIKAQIDTFNKSGLNCRLYVLPFQYGLSGLQQLVCRLPFSNLNPTWSYSADFEEVDYIYFRRPLCITWHTLKVLKEIRKNNTRVKIIMEIPTYPYDKELLCQAKLWPFYLKDIINRRSLKKYIDRIAVFTEDSELFGIPAIRFTNGINLEQIKAINPGKKDGSNIDLIVVSSFEEWHGYDRILKSLGEYYKGNPDNKRSVYLHMVGDGQNMHEYRQIVEKYKIQDYVKFYGRVYGKELDVIYNISDIAVDVLGMYRKNNNISCSLKSREYFAKGLPVISGCMIDLLEDVDWFKYFRQFPNDSSLINIDDIVSFYDKIYSNVSREIVIRKIRDFADRNCDMEGSIEEITRYIQS
jgi:glycosyltransferase involved in cell wall biosynthesis